MKVISYSLFGYNTERKENCFDFASYLRTFGICLRMNKLLYPQWTTILHLDKSTYDGFKNYFDRLKLIGLEIEICSDAPLCKAMLWRMKPCFNNKYSHVICRDVDSPATYREAQMVEEWIFGNTKASHAITDSISHTIPMMGGMIGFMPEHFKHRTGYSTWEEMINDSPYDFNNKGTDQDFLNNFIYPKFAQQGKDSITQHYILGMPNTFLSDYHNSVPNILLSINDSEELKQSNDICGHVGASGYYEGATFRFLYKHWHKLNDILEVEKLHPEIFFWVNEIK